MNVVHSLSVLVATAAFALPVVADEDLLASPGGSYKDFLGDTVGIPNSMAGGPCLALDGDMLVAGADHRGFPPNHGAVSVFRRSGSYWYESQELSSVTGGNFGRALALDLDAGFLMVGAPHDSFAAVPDTGSVSSFRWDGTSWAVEARLFASTPTTDDTFGCVVAVDGDVLAVTSGLGEAASFGTSPGRVTVFRRASGTWNLEQELDGEFPGHAFGASIAIDGDRLAVGATGEGTATGAVILYVWNGTSWEEEDRVTWPGLNPGSRFGFAVALEGELLAVGVPSRSRVYTFRRTLGAWTAEDELFSGFPAMGYGVSLAGDRLAACGNGRVVPYDWDGATWVQDGSLTAAYPIEGFGDAVAVDGPVLAVAAPDTDVVGGEEDQGAILVYDDTEHAWIDAGGGKPGLLGTPPVLVGQGDLTPSTLNRAELTNAAPLSFAAAFVSTTSTPVPFEGGTLLAFPWTRIFYFVTDGVGVDVTYTMPFNAPPGIDLWLQFAVAEDSGFPGGQAVSISNAIRGTVP